MDDGQPSPIIKRTTKLKKSTTGKNEEEGDDEEVIPCTQQPERKKRLFGKAKKERPEDAAVLLGRLKEGGVANSLAGRWDDTLPDAVHRPLCKQPAQLLCPADCEGLGRSGCFYDPGCADGGLGCNAGGKTLCRFCEFGAFHAIKCAP